MEEERSDQEDEEDERSEQEDERTVNGGNGSIVIGIVMGAGSVTRPGNE